jgi:hypothetical protein
MREVVLHGFYRSTHVSNAKPVPTARGVDFLFHDIGTAKGRPGREAMLAKAPIERTRCRETDHRAAARTS